MQATRFHSMKNQSSTSGRTDSSQCGPCGPIYLSGNWGVGHTTLRTLIRKGYLALGQFDKQRSTYGISYLSKRPKKQIETGELILDYDRTRNVVKVQYQEAIERHVKSVWHRTAHDAGIYGSDLLGSIIGEGRKFPFPKSLFAVRDSFASIVRANKEP